ncbi:MAG: hypothetical protein QOJ29_1576, partial [Thermoleophilaceae bacterium]|nr:hypothetical protein [Thermoleophilaceae bacterium]
MRSGRIVGVEALARWSSPRYGNVPPSVFVPQAERSGAAIQALTEWTLDAAIRQARAWQLDGHDLTVAVNLSPRSVLDASLTGLIRGML